jgi:hypothetical protein
MSSLVPLRHLPVGAIALLGLLSACGNGGLISTGGKDTGPAGGGTPNVYITSDLVDFGVVPKNYIASENIQVQNTGTDTLVISAIEFDEGSFFASAGAGLQIPAGTATTLALKFQPTDYADHAGSLLISTNDPDEPNVTIALRGGVVTDADEDGHDSADASGDDCNDDDPNVYPGAADRWYDGVDSDCSGNDDYDQDGDGFQTDVWNESETTGGDCQDSNADIHPGAADSWYDGIDSDCDGSDDFDKDGDGWRSEAHGAGSDCDDEDANVSPDGDEIMNGADDDCDGSSDAAVPGYSADVVISGASTGDRAGSALTTGDLDEDGRADLIIGAYNYLSGRGAVSIFDGASIDASDGTTIEDGQNYFSGDGSTDYLGYEAAFLSSFSIDEGPHLAVGAPYANGYYGAVYVLSGTDAFFGGDTSDAIVTVTGGAAASNSYLVGRGLSQDLDLDGDSLEELFGFYQTSSSTTDGTPYLWLLYGDALGSYTVDSTDARFTTDGAGQRMYKSVPTGGDLNGDGYDDAIYCDHLSDYLETNDGATWAIWGGTTRHSGTANIEAAGTMVTSGDQYERQGWICSLGGDRDGDGDEELWVYNPGLGELYLLPGGNDMTAGRIEAETEAIVTYTFGTNDPEPITLRKMGDWTGDGGDEMALGLTTGTSGSGEVWIFSSEDDDGEYDAEDAAWATVVGQNDTDEGWYQSTLGTSIADIPNDLNDDGNYDFVVGDPDWGDTTGSTAYEGRVYVSFGLY